MMINYNAITNHGIFNIGEMTKKAAENIEKLSSGRKINHASDDPAGMVLSQKMLSQISSIEQKISNEEMQVRKLEVADGRLSTLSTTLTDVRDIALTAASSGTLDKSQTEALQQAANDSVKSYNQSVRDSSFGNQNLLDGSDGSVANIEELPQLDLSTAEKAADAIAKLDKVSEEVSSAQGEAGARQSQEVEASINSLKNELSNLSEAESIIADTDFAQEYSLLVANQIKLQAATAMMSQGNLKASMMTSLMGTP